MTKILTFLVLLLWSAVAAAQSAPLVPAFLCVPYLKTGDWQGSQLVLGLTPNGAWMKFNCINLKLKLQKPYYMVGPLSQVRATYAAANSVLYAKDPLVEMKAQATRLMTKPLTDPSLTAIKADMDAGRGTF